MSTQAFVGSPSGHWTSKSRSPFWMRKCAALRGGDGRWSQGPPLSLIASVLLGGGAGGGGGAGWAIVLNVSIASARLGIKSVFICGFSVDAPGRLVSLAPGLCVRSNLRRVGTDLVTLLL
jgi:hypothetical protein